MTHPPRCRGIGAPAAKRARRVEPWSRVVAALGLVALVALAAAPAVAQDTPSLEALRERAARVEEARGRDAARDAL
ncbi:MAG: hypothetical protein KF729_05540, partial [Sandaracinaceae bacterium]|nr:hypothetical protein [Sandaracinaceae bacterium]